MRAAAASATPVGTPTAASGQPDLTDAPQTHQTAELPSGLRVVTERMPSVRSVAMGLFVRTGLAGTR